MRKIIVFGANSAIAQAAVRILADQGHSLYLVGRDPTKLKAVCDDLTTRGVKLAGSKALDLNDCSMHPAVLAEANAALGGYDTVFIAHGELGDQAEAQKSFAALHRILETNFLSQASLLTYVANHFEAQKKGTIAVISSVAGDRGRQSNYAYGTAKGAMSVFLSGLRNRLAPSGVQVITIKPGFVDTPMTRNFAKGGPLWATPEEIAKGIVCAIDSRKDVVYLPWYWFWIMAIIKSIPEGIFKRLKL